MPPVVPLKGSVAVVTGASTGIGRATALALAREGASVVVAARRMEKLARLASEIESRGGRAMAVACDVTSWEDVQSLAEKVRSRFGHCEILVNNAGIPGGGLFDELSVPRLKLVVDTNLMGTIYGVKAFLPMMLQAGRGHIVNLASLAGRHAVPKAAIYSASKHAISALSESLDYEYQDRSIRATSVNPALAATEGFPQDGRPKWLVMSAEHVAEAIVDAVRHGRAPQVTVPRWAGVFEFFKVTVPWAYRPVVRSVLGKHHRPSLAEPPGGEPSEAPE